MKYLLSLIKPEISIITDITQRYLEGYGDMNKMMREYQLLVEKTSARGSVILNCDNPRIKELRKCGQSRTILFGFCKEADLQAKKIATEKNGEAIKVNTEQGENEYCLNRFGIHHIYAFLTSLAVKQSLSYVYSKKKK
jgi:UDP-N-acetylmuramoyl-tripeptide--D-alanyl-D-alanine ligase